MPYADPKKQKEYNRQKYITRQHLWKNPDGSWKKSNCDHKSASRKHYWKNREVILNKRKAQIQAAREERTSKCPICDVYDVLVWDHNHATGAFRAYICQSCNLALGHARDNPETLRALAEYLECHKNN